MVCGMWGFERERGGMGVVGLMGERGVWWGRGRGRGQVLKMGRLFRGGRVVGR